MKIARLIILSQYRYLEAISNIFTPFLLKQTCVGMLTRIEIYRRRRSNYMALDIYLYIYGESKCQPSQVNTSYRMKCFTGHCKQVSIALLYQSRLIL